MEHRENEQYSQLLRNLKDIQQILHIHLNHEELLIQAFAHKSFLNEYAHILSHSYERLEFLGDSILNLAVTEYLFTTYPEAAEGELSQIKSQWVSQNSLCQTMSAYGISHFLLTGKGERMSKLHQQEAVLADLFEAIIGAIFIDQGWSTAQNFILREHISHCDIVQLQKNNPKAALQEWCLQHKLGLPRYTVLREEGPQHDPLFTVGVLIQDRCIHESSGKTKRQAEAEAAKGALTRISEYPRKKT